MELKFCFRLYSDRGWFRSNCTFMELKWWRTSWTRFSNLVQIVPLWNWNSKSSSYRSSFSAFKLYLYGIEIWLTQSAQYQNWVQIVPLWNWNDLTVSLNGSSSLVQIVPLWNWNWWLTASRMENVRSNCTFMELKYECKRLGCRFL